MAAASRGFGRPRCWRSRPPASPRRRIAQRRGALAVAAQVRPGDLDILHGGGDRGPPGDLGLFRRRDLRVAAGAQQALVEDRQAQIGTEGPAVDAVGTSHRAAERQRRIERRLGHADLGHRRRKIGFRAAHVGPVAQQVGRHAGLPARGSPELRRAAVHPLQDRTGGLVEQAGDGIDIRVEQRRVLRHRRARVRQQRLGLGDLVSGRAARPELHAGDVHGFLARADRLASQSQRLLVVARVGIGGDQLRQPGQPRGLHLGAGRGERGDRALALAADAAEEVDHEGGAQIGIVDGLDAVDRLAALAGARPVERARGGGIDAGRPQVGLGLADPLAGSHHVEVLAQPARHQLVQHRVTVILPPGLAGNRADRAGIARREARGQGRFGALEDGADGTAGNGQQHEYG